MHKSPLILLVTTLVISLRVSSAQTPRPWSLPSLHNASVWSERMNDPIVRATDKGLRVEIARERTWAIAAAPKVVIPANVRVVRVRVRELGGGARWLMRIYGDVRGNGNETTFGPFGGMTNSGVCEIPVDPRMFHGLSAKPMQLQLGLEGNAGDFVVFEAVNFVTGTQPLKPRNAPGQKSIDAVDMMPNIPRPLKIIDWRAKARAYDKFVFNMNAKGEFLPLTWIDNSHINNERDTFGMSSYVGDGRLGMSNHESVTSMGAVLGASLVGINKRTQEHDYVRMCEAFYNRASGENLILNLQKQGTGGSFWYEIWPHIVFYAIADLYPKTGDLDSIVQSTATRWASAVTAMDGNFDHTAFNMATMKPFDGQWIEPDAAAGIGWLEYAVWNKHKTPASLQAADSCMQALSAHKGNPYYEVLLPWGALTAARMNAELGRKYDVDKLINWSFGISDCRGGWAVILNRWGDYDCAGLLGSVDNGGGYAFAMNTFAQAGALTPIARYRPSYARAIGKWMLNLTNAARLFYPPELPAGHQSSAFWKGDPSGVIAYEGLRYRWEGATPCATGDPVALKWGPKTDLGLYGSSYVGLLGGIVRTTNIPAILQLDCLATDFYRQRAYPTYLVYNPYPAAKTVRLAVGAKQCDLYDVVSGRYIAKSVKDSASVKLPADNAMVIVCAPAGGKLTPKGRATFINDVVVDFGAR